MSTPAEYFQKLNSTLTNEKAKIVGAVYQFNLTGDNAGTWVVDLKKDADWVTEGPADNAECKITMKDSDFMDLVTGKLAGPQAFMMGKLKIDGNMGLAMKLSNVLTR